MNFNLRAALVEALAYPSLTPRVEAIKTAVSREVEDVDPSAEAHHTAYFNHSQIPDIVVKWPRENRERFLFLRDVQPSAWLRADLADVADRAPVVVNLETLDPDDTVSEDARISVSQTAREAGVWLTDPGGMDALSRSNAEGGAVTALLGQAMIQGGRGLFAERDSQLLRDSAALGFEAAAGLEAEATSLAVTALEASMDPTQASRFTRVLRAIWEGNGGSSAAFPRTEALGRLSSSDLTYLLMSLQDAPADFWRRLGGGIDLEQIAALDVPESLDSFQLLVSANLDRLAAKAVRVRYRQSFLIGSSARFSWTREKAGVGLSGPGFVAAIAPRILDQLPPPEEADGISYDELVKRHEVAGVDIPRVEALLSNGARVSYDGEQKSAMADPKLQTSLATWGTFRIVSGSATSHDGRTLNVDFKTRTAAAPTSGQLALHDLLVSAVPLLEGMDADALDEMVQFLSHALHRGAGTLPSIEW